MSIVSLKSVKIKEAVKKAPKKVQRTAGRQQSKYWNKIITALEAGKAFKTSSMNEVRYILATMGKKHGTRAAISRLQSDGTRAVAMRKFTKAA